MNSNGFLLHNYHLVRQPDEFLDHMHWWARSIVEDHVQMIDTKRSEVCGRVEFGVQTDDESDVALGEM